MLNEKLALKREVKLILSLSKFKLQRLLNFLRGMSICQSSIFGGGGVDVAPRIHKMFNATNLEAGRKADPFKYTAAQRKKERKRLGSNTNMGSKKHLGLSHTHTRYCLIKIVVTNICIGFTLQNKRHGIELYIVKLRCRRI